MDGQGLRMGKPSKFEFNFPLPASLSTFHRSIINLSPLALPLLPPSLAAADATAVDLSDTDNVSSSPAITNEAESSR